MRPGFESRDELGFFHFRIAVNLFLLSFVLDKSKKEAGKAQIKKILPMVPPGPLDYLTDDVESFVRSKNTQASVIGQIRELSKLIVFKEINGRYIGRV